MEINITLLILTGIAAISDLRNRKIPNSLILIGLIIGLSLSVLTRGTEGLLISLIGFLLGFAMLLPGYLLRYTGAGDVKLLAMLGVFTGPTILLQVFLAAVLSGATYVLLQSLWSLIENGGKTSLQRYQSMLQILLTTGQFRYIPSEQGTTVLKQRLPMAPFYALGVLFVLGLPLVK